MNEKETAAKSFDWTALANGHPAKAFHLEDMALAGFLDDLEAQIVQEGDVAEICRWFSRLNAIHVLYGKKEMLFMPILYRHGVTGPSQVLWDTDDEIKKNVRALAKDLSPEHYGERKEKISALLQSIREMIRKDESILLPLSFRFFTEEEWLMIYRDSLAMGVAFLPELPHWKEGDDWLKIKEAEERERYADEKVCFPAGELTLRQLKGIFSLLPLDITFIDKDDILRFFVNEGKIFERPLLALGNDVRDCHPSRILPVIDQLLEDFKTKKRTQMEVWRTIKGKPVGVRYLAVYDDAGEYIGTVEIVQDFTDAIEHFGGQDRRFGR